VIWSSFRVDGPVVYASHLPLRSSWLAALACVVVAGYVAGVMHGPAVVWLLAVAIAASSLRSTRRWTRAIAVAATFILGLLLGLHLLPGFSNPIVLHDVVVAPGALPYTQYLNFDKTLGALILLGASGWTPMRPVTEWREAFRRAAPWMIATVALAMSAAVAVGFVRFDPRWPSLFLVWAPINLLTTCVSEETFFREFIQKHLRSIAAPRSDTSAVIVSGVLFGVAHFAGGWRYVVIATLAGLGYAMVYRRTSRLEMSVLAHFTVNAVHFVLFTYPALAH
jgi:membrane protease YdiL (CAAX protease family)